MASKPKFILADEPTGALDSKTTEDVLNLFDQLHHQGITIVLTERRRPFHYLRDFTDLGIDLCDFTLLVVKSGYLSPELQSISAPSYLMLTDGAVCQHFARLENKFRKRPLFPFENPEEFVPFVSHKKREKYLKVVQNDTKRDLRKRFFSRKFNLSSYLYHVIC